MGQPLWLRGAAVVAALAGIAPEEVASAFEPDDARLLCDAMAALVIHGDREATARAIVRERIALTMAVRRVSHTTREEWLTLAAMVMASVLRSVSSTERAALVRAMDAELAQRTVALARIAPQCDASAVLVVLTKMVQRLGRLPNGEELGALVAAALGREELATPLVVHATLRAARALGLSVREAFAVYEGTFVPSSGGTV